MRSDSSGGAAVSGCSSLAALFARVLEGVCTVERGLIRTRWRGREVRVRTDSERSPERIRSVRVVFVPSSSGGMTGGVAASERGRGF
jgi:hypothetical protein